MELKVIFLEIVSLDLYSDKVWEFSIFSFCTPRPDDIYGRPLLIMFLTADLSFVTGSSVRTDRDVECAVVLCLIIYTKKSLNSDWLRKECSSSVT